MSNRVSWTCAIGLALLAGMAPLAVYQQSVRAGQGLRLVRRPPSAETIAIWQAETDEYHRVIQGGEFHKPLELFVEYPGHEQVKLIGVDDADYPDSTPVVGVDVDGAQCAFILDEMKDPARHVVNLVISQTPISVAYCDLVDCVRVVTDDSRAAIPLNVGGLDVDNQLVLLLRGKRYGQESPDLPLADHPFTRTTLGDWKNRYPDTMISVPPSVD